MELFSNDALGVALLPFFTVRDVNLEPIDEMEPPTTAATATSMSSLVAPAGKRYRGVRQRPWGKWTDMSGYECVPVIFPANNSVPEFPVYRRSSSFNSLIPCLSETWGDLPLKVDDAEDMVIYGFLRDAVSVGWTPFNLTAADINGDYAQLNFPNLHHSGSHISGNFGKYKQLHSAVDAKLIAICQSLVQGKSNAQLNSECLGNGKTKEDAPGFSLDVSQSTPKHNLTSQSHPNESLAVDQQEGIPQYSDTLPTDQALAVTVDTNSVGVKEILPPQFLPKARQEKPNEDFGGDKIEAVGMGGEGAGEGEMEEDQLIVDEEGSPQLINSDNLPSDQAAAVTVDTNSVVGKEITPLQFSRTAQQKNSDEAFGNDEVEEGGTAGQFDSRCSAKRKRKEKNPRRERRNKKTTGVRIGSPSVDNLQTKGRSLKNDAKRLKGVRLENPDENSCNDEVEAVGMGGVGTGEGEVKEGKLNCGSSDKGERNEKTPQGERANNKGTGVRIEIPLEEILKCKDKCRKDAATHLQVSISTFKRVCRGYNIRRWPPREVDKLIDQSRPSESPSVVDQEQIRQLNCDTELRSNQASIETNSVTVKAKYETVTIKFRLSRPWRKVELEENVKKRLGLEVGTYHTEYKDEDGELILISCDEDLKDCIPNSSPMGTCSIQLFLRDKVDHECPIDQL